ncbi:MAG: hypothetical protein SCARUB_03005 [Candidatus Scalindua rubra]|uniref:Uncharacterized protein n=1 Tax=Candidatus Scalindua rubra TaxID=1872076 RepID=A0A1E3X8A0_9BACT|nr:MAG: hypothetical protein SCARUB_03005 [Candidatus Scalindua rubra]
MMKVQYLKKFLKQLSRIPPEIRLKIEKFVFEELPYKSSISESGKIEKHYFVKKKLGGNFFFLARADFIPKYPLASVSFFESSLVEENSSKELIACLNSLKVTGLVSRILLTLIFIME